MSSRCAARWSEIAASVRGPGAGQGPPHAREETEEQGSPADLANGLVRAHHHSVTQPRICLPWAGRYGITAARPVPRRCGQGGAMPASYAHSGRNKDCSDWQSLRDHLVGVADLARRFAEAARPGDPALAAAAYAAGLLHDLGKYRAEFQQMIRGLHPRNDKTHHKQAGAAKAADAGNGPAAFAIAGHHGGLPDYGGLADLLSGPSGRAVTAAVWPS